MAEPDADAVRVVARAVLDERAGACHPEHVEIADEIARRLFGRAEPELPLGPGIFLRDLDDVAPEVAAAHISWVAVPVTKGNRRVNRDRDWYRRFREAGGRVCVWSWFTTDPAKITAAVKFGAEVGAEWFMINAEKELRGEPELAERLVRAARTACDAHGPMLGLSSYSVTTTIRDFPWRAFSALCDFGSPQIYDRRGAYDPKYPRRALRSWYTKGFRKLVAGVGLHVRRQPRGWRYRSRDELGRHLGLFPAAYRPTVVGWTLGTRGRIPERVLRDLRATVPAS